MATATRVPVRPVPSTYVLELSEEEATFLRDIFWVVGGDPHESRRKHADAIDMALAGAGVDFHPRRHR